MPTNQFKTILTCDACKQPTDACAICKWPNKSRKPRKSRKLWLAQARVLSPSSRFPQRQRSTKETNGDHRICCEACANKPMA